MSLFHPIPEMRCLMCDTRLNHASDNHESTAPKPGDWTLCLYCQGLMVFQDDLTLRLPTEAEQAEAATDPAIVEIRQFADHFSFVLGKSVRH